LFIGNIFIRPRLALAPMAGITDHPYRLICKRHGCGLVYSEMVNARGVLVEPQKYFNSYLYASPEEKPVVFQLFGNEPEVMASAGKLLVEKAGADLIDVNMGCSVPKILKNREGAWLMREPYLAMKVIERMTETIEVPVTVKLRAGWEDLPSSAITMAESAEKLGISALAVHGRTVEQRFYGKADWNIIKAVKDRVNIPVWGNGDVTDPHEAEDLLQYSGCDGVMIGRAARGNPWIFSRTSSWLEGDKYHLEASPAEIKDVVITHLNLQINFRGEKIGVREMRKHAGWYLKGTRGAARIRDVINKITTAEAFKETIKEWYTLNYCSD